MASQSQKQQPAMEWTEQHDVLFLREMITSDLFDYKKGSPDRGRIWEAMQECLNTIECPKFALKDKRAVRDRWNLLQTKFKKRMREEEKASGIDPEISERDVLIEELSEKEDSLSVKTDKKKADKEAAEEVRRRAMERVKETTKRRNSGSDAEGGKKSRKSSGEVVDFLREKAKSEQGLRQQELDLRKEEQQRCAKQQEDLLKDVHGHCYCACNYASNRMLLSARSTGAQATSE